MPDRVHVKQGTVGRTLRTIAFGGLAIALSAGCSAGPGTSASAAVAAPVKVGEHAPALQAGNLFGGSVTVGAPQDRLVLLAFVDTTQGTTAWQASRAAGTICVSMATQYSAKGLHVDLVDVSHLYSGANATDADLINLHYDWNLGAANLVDAADSPRIAAQYGVTSAPTVLLIGSDRTVLDVWTATLLPATVALAVQKALPSSSDGPVHSG
jgi:hypothetical protein